MASYGHSCHSLKGGKSFPQQVTTLINTQDSGGIGKRWPGLGLRKAKSQIFSTHTQPGLMCLLTWFSQLPSLRGNWRCASWTPGQGQSDAVAGCPLAVVQAIQLPCQSTDRVTSLSLCPLTSDLPYKLLQVLCPAGPHQSHHGLLFPRKPSVLHADGHRHLFRSVALSWSPWLRTLTCLTVISPFSLRHGNVA